MRKKAPKRNREDAAHEQIKALVSRRPQANSPYLGTCPSSGGADIILHSNSPAEWSQSINSYGVWHLVNPNLPEDPTPKKPEAPPLPEVKPGVAPELYEARLSIFETLGRIYDAEMDQYWKDQLRLSDFSHYIVEHISPANFEAIVPGSSNDYQLLRLLKQCCLGYSSVY